MTQFYSFMDSPIGRLLLTADGTHLTGLYTGRLNEQAEPDQGWIAAPDLFPFAETRQQLSAYFARRLTEFDLPIKLIGTTFQQSVWHELTRIPYGAVISYGELARRIGNPKAVRAVGLANGRNPISVIVPCHRVIGANGSLTGYGGGLPRKQFLLTLEAEQLQIHAPCPEEISGAREVSRCRAVTAL